MFLSALGFTLKTFITGVFLAMGFANGYVLGEYLKTWLQTAITALQIRLHGWPGLRNWLAGRLAQLAESQQIPALAN